MRPAPVAGGRPTRAQAVEAAHEDLPQRDATARGRLEPHPGGAGVPPRSTEYGELQRKYAFYSQFNSTPTPPRPRLLHLFGMFVVGAITGLAAAWSLQGSTLPSLAVELPKSVLHHSAASWHVPAEHAAAPKGINPGELPYDGAPSDAPAAPAAPVPDALAKRTPPEDRGKQPASASAGDASVKAASPKRAAPAETRTRAGGDKAAKAAPQKKHHSRRRAAKDREIERIRQQAAEELKKKTDEERPSGSTHSGARYPARRQAAPIVEKSTGTRALLARCEHAGNIFLREKCKWQLCGGMWGKNGCPSYPQISAY